MAEFSLFPTAHWATQNAQGIAVVWKRGDSAFLPSLPTQISWQIWHQLIKQAVIFLKKRAISAESLVAYSGSCRLAGVICYLATVLLGAKIIILNPAMSTHQRARVLRNNGITYCFTDEDFADFLPEKVVFEESLSETTACVDDQFFPHVPATLTLTSGSSGTPKAVVHSIQNHLDNAEGVCDLMEFRGENSWLLSLPLFHVSGQGIIWRWLAVGATLWIDEDKSTFWQTLSQVSHASLVPTQLQRYLNQIDIIKPPQFKQKILLGGAFIPSELIAQAQVQQIETYAGYGVTEMASTICAVKNALDSVGKPLLGRDVCLEQGEIWVRGAGLGLGYWLNQTLVPLINHQGWFATKDKGEWHNGKLVVKGRLDNLFISGGENIQPEEIEKVLFQSGLIKQAVVVPIADNEFGQRPVAVVDFIAEYSAQAVAFLQDFARHHLEKFKLPIAYFPLDITQQTGLKISRQQLQQQIALKIREQHNV